MAALLAAVWRAQLHRDPGEAHVTAESPPMAVASLAYTLPSLLASPQWRPAADAAASRLAALAQHPAGSATVRCQVLVRSHQDALICLQHAHAERKKTARSHVPMMRGHTA